MVGHIDGRAGSIDVLQAHDLHTQTADPQNRTAPQAGHVMNAIAGFGKKGDQNGGQTKYDGPDDRPKVDHDGVQKCHKVARIGVVCHGR